MTGIPVGSTFGALDVALPAFGAVHGSSALGGPFTASLAAGSALGPLVYGSAPRRFGTPAQTCIRLAVFQPLVCLPLLLAPGVAPMLALGVLAGTFIAPTITARTRIARVTMPSGTCQWYSVPAFSCGSKKGGNFASPATGSSPAGSSPSQSSLLAKYSQLSPRIRRRRWFRARWDRP